MKKAFLQAPLIAALAFAIPEAWRQVNDPGPGYIPVINELLLLVFGYLAAFAGNAVVIIPLCLLVRLKSSNPLAGLLFGLFVALVVTTVAYAFEIFDYQPSIFHPAYLYPLFIPLFILTVLSFFFLTRPKAEAEGAGTTDTAGSPEDSTPDHNA